MGRAFVFGDDIDTDVLAPGSLMKLAPDALAAHCLEAIDPDFAKTVKPGDVLIAGRNFGLGSSREQAAVSLRLLGISAIVARSFARIFYRNAINLGLPAVVLDQALEIEAGHELELDLAAGFIDDVTAAVRYRVTPIPPHLMAMIDDGGLIAHLRRRASNRPTTNENRENGSDRNA